MWSSWFSQLAELNKLTADVMDCFCVRSFVPCGTHFGKPVFRTERLLSFCECKSQILPNWYLPCCHPVLLSWQTRLSTAGLGSGPDLAQIRLESGPAMPERVQIHLRAICHQGQMHCHTGLCLHNWPNQNNPSHFLWGTCSSSFANYGKKLRGMRNQVCKKGEFKMNMEHFHKSLARGKLQREKKGLRGIQHSDKCNKLFKDSSNRLGLSIHPVCFLHAYRQAV